MPIGVLKTKKMIFSYREAIYETMHDALANQSNVVILGQGVNDPAGFFGTTLNLGKKFGYDRVINMPLSEEGMTGIAIGMALNGLYPIQTHMRADFVLLAMNQIINLAAKYKYMFGGKFRIPMLTRLVIGRSWGQGAQHSQSFQSMLSHIPGLRVIMPSTAESILQCYPYILSNCQEPVLSFEHRLIYDLSFDVNSEMKMCKYNPLTSYVARAGRDVTIVATSIMVLEAIRAARYLKELKNIECEVIDLNCISHPDRSVLLQSVSKTGRLIVVDTGWQAYGVCSEICRVVAESNPGLLKVPVITIGFQPSPCPTSKSLENLFYPNINTIIKAVSKQLYHKEDAIPFSGEESIREVYRGFNGPF